MRSSDVQYEPRKCDWCGRNEAKKKSRILVRGVNAPLPLEAKKIVKI